MRFYITLLLLLSTFIFSTASAQVVVNESYDKAANRIFSKNSENHVIKNRVAALEQDQRNSSLGKLKVIVELPSPALISAFPKKRRFAKDNAEINRSIESKRLIINTEQHNVLKALKSKGIAFKQSRKFSRVYNGISLEIEAQELSSLGNIPGIKKVHIVRDRFIHLAESVPIIQADQVWNLKDTSDKGITGQGVKVAILDTGIDYTRAELGGCFGEGCRVVSGYDFMNDDSDPMDDHGHGTHVAGIVGMNGEVKGVAPDVNFYAYKVCDNYCPTDGVIAALERAIDPDGDPLTDDGVDIINMSLGGPGGLDDPLTVAVNALENEDVLVVISAGNEGSGSQTIASPGNATTALTVAATNKDDTIASYSSRGPVLSEIFQKPEISAPGSDIYSLGIGGGLVSLSGTSMAAPHVTGAAALLKQLYPNLDSEAYKSLLVNNTDNIGLPFVQSGSGRLNALKAIETAVITDKPYVMFERLDRAQSIWSHTRTLRITNVLDEAITINLTIDNDESAIGYSLGDQSEVLLEIGESHTITIDLEINSIDLMQTTDFIHQAFLNISRNGHQSSVPLLVFDAIKFEWHTEGYATSIWFNKLDGGMNLLEEYSTQGGFFATSGEYAISAIFDDSEKVSWVVKEVTLSDEDLSVNVDENSAVNEIKVTNFVDHEGNSRNLETLYGSGMFIELAHPDSKYRHAQWFNGWTNDVKNGMFVSKPVYVSNLSDKFELNYSLLYGDTLSSSDDYHLYTYAGHHVGVEENISIVLDGQLPTKLTFDVSVPDFTEHEYLWYFYSNLSSSSYIESGWYTSGSGISGPRDMLSSDDTEYLGTRFKFNVHGNNQPLSRISNYEFGMTEVGSWTNDISIPSFTFENDANSLTGDSDAAFNIDMEGLSYSLNIFDWSGKVYVDKRVLAPHWVQYQAPSAAPILLTCSSFIKKQIDNPSSQVNIDTSEIESCDSPSFRAEYKNYLFGVGYESTSTLAAPESFNTVKLESVNLEDLLNHDKGSEEVTTALVGISPGPLSDEEVTLEAYINYSGSWVPIEVSRASSESRTVYFSLYFPTLDEPYITSLKLVYGAEGHQGENIISNAFILGGTKEEMEQFDRDEDGVFDHLDSDKDNDGIPDGVELIHQLNHFDATDAEKDQDGDGVSNIEEYLTGRSISLLEGDSDGDGVADHLDEFPNDPNESADTDGDGIGNNADTDDDNDGVEDHLDAFPLDASESVDTDSDGIGNNADTDDDNDGVDDENDAFPLDASEFSDFDGDGTGDNADLDDDNDGVDDESDAFPFDASETEDTDSDGIGNNADSDDDNDGVEDGSDAFPLDANEYIDTDNDSLGNNADTDDDNDGVEDFEDAFPLDSAESLDTDGDGIGNNADTDDDGDGVSDNNDAYPLDANRSVSQSTNSNSTSSSSSGGGYSPIELIILSLFLSVIRLIRYKNSIKGTI